MPVAGSSSLLLGSVPSATADRVFRVAERIDPHWDGVWSRGASAVWLTLREARALASSDFGGSSGVPAFVDLSGEQGLRRLGWPSSWQLVLDVLACLDTYRTLSAQQLAYLVGDARVADPDSRVMWDLFALGLVDVGMTRSGVSGREVRGARLFRPAQTREFDRVVLPRLTFEEWASVTGGRDWESTGQYDRHNVLTNELLLRVAELLPVSAVVGEKLSDLETLGFSSLGLQPPVMRIQRSADGVIVRSDGLRIAVETTASTGSAFQAKCDRWARMLHDRRLADSGLVVVFVVAPRAGESNSKQRVTSGLVQRCVARAAARTPGVVGDRTASRMGVVSWESWFPARGRVSPDFFRLVVRMPCGGDAANPWERVALLDPACVPGPVDDRVRLSGSVLAGLRSQPHHLASVCRAPMLWRVASSRSGLGGVVPPRVNVRTGLPFSGDVEALGAAGAPRVPERLLPVVRER